MPAYSAPRVVYRGTFGERYRPLVRREACSADAEVSVTPDHETTEVEGWVMRTPFSHAATISRSSRSASS